MVVIKLRALGVILLLFASSVMAGTENQETEQGAVSSTTSTPPAASPVGRGKGSPGMMQHRQEMMNQRRAMMEQKQAMREQHMARVEERLANIEGLLRELVELQKK